MKMIDVYIKKQYITLEIFIKFDWLYISIM